MCKGRLPPLCLALLWLCGVKAWSSSFVGSRVIDVPVSDSFLMMRFPVVEQWRVLKNGALVGVVRNHPTIEDGDTITTSPLKVPDAAAPRGIVETRSGSKYRLGNPKSFPENINGQKQKPTSVGMVRKPVSKGLGAKMRTASTDKSATTKKPIQRKPTEAAAIELREAWKRARTAYDLTGAAVGDYLLAGRVARSTSGKSKLWRCYKTDENGIPVGEALMMKVSPNKEALQRESKNYERVTSGFTRGQFVQFVEYIEKAGEGKEFAKQGAIVMERGEMDLKAYIASMGPLSGKALREAAVAAVQCLQAVHSCALVWTDLKTENFVVRLEDKKFGVKGIDLESAMPYKDNPVDYSPEACPPEFAEAFLAGEGPYFILDYSYDIWSLGIMLYEISTGRSAFEGKSPSQITKILKTPGYEADLSAVEDDNLRDLIGSCLKTDPKARLSLPQVLLHPYFLTTGIGPFSF